ncbi:hypothetical protein Tco_0921247 [Tanacetum coccineum]
MVDEHHKEVQKASTSKGVESPNPIHEIPTLVDEKNEKMKSFPLVLRASIMKSKSGGKERFWREGVEEWDSSMVTYGKKKKFKELFNAEFTPPRKLIEFEKSSKLLCKLIYGE